MHLGLHLVNQHSQPMHTQDTDPQHAPQTMWPNAHTRQRAWPHVQTGHTLWNTMRSTQNTGLEQPPTHSLRMSVLGTGFPGGSVVMSPSASAGRAGNAGAIPGWGRSPGGGNGNPPQYSCLENPLDRGACRSTVHGVTKSWTQLSNFHFYFQTMH